MDLHNVQRVIAINVVIVEEAEELIRRWALQEWHTELEEKVVRGVERRQRARRLQIRGDRAIGSGRRR